MIRRNAKTILVGAVCMLAGMAWTAVASWHPTSSGTAWTKAHSMPAGNTPSASATNRSVMLVWPASTFPGGGSADGYVVKRYDLSNQAQTVLSGCSGTITTLTCTEDAVPAGSWKYSITPKRSNWTGAESAKSTTVTVASPSLSFSSSTTVTSLPTTLSGTISNYVPGQTVTFRLDNPTTGTLLTGSISPTPVPGSGTSSVSVTIPAGTSNGSHTVYAVGSSGDTASQGITVAAPTVTSTVLDKSSGCVSGFLKQAGGYFVYANVTGSPSSVTANVSSMTTGGTAVAMASGSYTVGGTTYNYRSALQTASNPLAAGSKSYTVTATGGGSLSGSATVDNTQPAASDVQPINKTGNTAGRPEIGDTITYDYTETMDPCSLLASWTGLTTANVVVRIANVGSTDDTVTIWDSANTTQLALGSIDLNSDEVSANATFGATGTASTMTQSTGRITITLGTASSGPRTGATAAAVWTPSTAAYDRAANANTAATATESGTSDLNF
jgi:hypothetical protein